MNKIEITKFAVNLVVGGGVSKIVHTVIKNNVDQPEKLTDQVQIVAGTFAIAGLVVNETRKYTDAKIDGAVKWYNETFTKKTEQETV